MKHTQLLITVLCTGYLVEASMLQSPSVILASITFLTMNAEVLGFFGFFRRRKTQPSSAFNLPSRLEETSSMPSGPVFPFSQGANEFNSFSAGNSFGEMSDTRFGNLYGNQQQQFRQQMAQQMTQQQIPQHVQQQVFQQMQQGPNGMADFGRFESEQGSPGMNVEEAESFFTLLAETDESQCISRLICEMGADPSKGGEFGQSISEIISGLRNFPPGTKSAHYNRIMQIGKQRGISACTSTFSACDDESLDVVRNAQTSDR